MGTNEKTDREKALEIFLKHNGDITNRAIAKLLKINEKTIGTWKSRDKWKDNLKRSTPPKKKSTSKKLSSREKQKMKIIEALNIANSYSPALDILIEVYLDCYEEYEHAKFNGLETESLRKELARLLRDLGLDISNKNMTTKKIEKEKQIDQPENKLVQFRQRMMK